MSTKPPTVHATPNSSLRDKPDTICGTRKSLRLFKRCDNPTLPVRTSLYSTAKRLEYDGDIAGALDFLYKAMQSGERVDSCMKDIAGLLNMMGRTLEAVEFLKCHAGQVTNEAGYTNLLTKLEGELARDSTDLPRGITVTVLDESLGPVTLALCDRLFPNPAKIRRILYTDEKGYTGAIHFASHSGARKALQVHKTCSDQIECSWSSLYTDARLRMLERIEKEETGYRCEKEQIPAHLLAFDSVRTIPIYRESDPSLPALSEDEIEKVHQLAKARAEASAVFESERNMSQVAVPLKTVSDLTVSPIKKEQEVSPFRTPSSTCSSSTRESVVLSTILANHQHLFGGADAGGISPFMTKMPNLEGGSISAMVIPFPRLRDHSETDQIRSYANTLTIMAQAMTTMAALVENQQAPPPPPPPVYTTPLRRHRLVSCATPSPIIQHYMFT